MDGHGKIADRPGFGRGRGLPAVGEFLDPFGKVQVPHVDRDAAAKKLWRQTKFLKDAKRAGLSNDERAEIVEFISENPFAGIEMAGTGGPRKVRFSAKGNGKSGGVRVITFYSGRDIPVFLLNVFGKGDKVNLTKAGCKALKKVLGEIAEVYRRTRQRQ